MEPRETDCLIARHLFGWTDIAQTKIRGVGCPDMLEWEGRPPGTSPEQKRGDIVPYCADANVDLQVLRFVRDTWPEDTLRLFKYRLNMRWNARKNGPKSTLYYGMTVTEQYEAGDYAVAALSTMDLIPIAELAER